MSRLRTICLLGLGEVGDALAGDLSALDRTRLVAWDTLFDDPGSLPSRHALRHPGLRRAGSADTAAKGCELVISAVTAAQDLAAARSVMPGLETDAWFLDVNSVSPDTKQTVADTVEEVGGRYVEAVILSPIRPGGIASPMLAGGPRADDFISLARKLGFSDFRYCDERIGIAAAIKLCRSVVVKGVEALLTESLLAARHYGVEDEVITSLQNLLPREGWMQHARYMIARSLKHGERRAEEMREAALTVARAGVEPLMSEACARRQDWAAQFPTALNEPGLAPLLDAVLARGREGVPGTSSPGEANTA